MGFFDIIFIDPPFTEDYPVDLDLSKVQKENGVIIWQFPSKVNIQWKVKPYKIYKYGESSLAINYCEV